MQCKGGMPEPEQDFVCDSEQENMGMQNKRIILEEEK
jgi:hypothetical protein